jgi:DNA-binding CsgD family transcriptional regulator
MAMDTPLVDKIYESCFVPEFWPEVLDELGRIGGAPGASLFVLKNDAHYCITSPEPQERAQRLIKEGWLSRGRIVSRLFAQRHSGFLIDVDFFTPEELEQEPIYRDVWRPQGVGWGMATAIPIPTGENAMIVLSRRTEHGPFERASAQRLDQLRPHLARSVLISARLQMERARAASEALAAMGIPALVLDEAGKVLAANALIEAMNGCVHWRAYDRVSLKDHIADHLLHDAIASIDLEVRPSVRSFPIRDAHANAIMVAHVIPIRLSARDIFLRCATVLAMTPVTPPQAPPVELVQSLFDLTPAEARVARSLAAGKTLENIASDGSVSLNTVRTHLHHVMEKTGCNRQAEVVALLTGIVPPRAAGPR